MAPTHLPVLLPQYVGGRHHAGSAAFSLSRAGYRQTPREQLGRKSGLTSAVYISRHSCRCSLRTSEHIYVVSASLIDINGNDREDRSSAIC